MTIAPQSMTLDEFLALYELDPVLEYTHGAVTEKMPPASDHSLLGQYICHQINAFAYPRKLALAISELRITNLATGVSWIPDVSAFVWDRIERDPKAREHGAVVPPDIAMEIASPGQSRRKQIERCKELVANGARIGQMFDPRTETIVDVRPGQAERRLRGDDVLDLGEVISGLTLVVRDLFAMFRFD